MQRLAGVTKWILQLSGLLCGVLGCSWSVERNWPNTANYVHFQKLHLTNFRPLKKKK